MRIPSRTLISSLTLVLALIVAGAPALAYPGAQQSAAPATSPPPTMSAKGIIVETMNSGGYTYLLIEGDGKKNWAAIPKTEVKVGQEVELAPGMTMNNFTSQTLGRTFERIVFSQGAVSVK